MNTLKFAVCACFALAASGAIAQERAYPNKVVRFITSLATGSSADAFGRAITDQLTRRVNQSFIMDPRPGAGGNLAAETVAKAAPDGYTLLMSSVASNAINASYYTSLNYDFRKDFAPVTKFGSIPNGLFVGPELPANNLKDLTALLKASPGKYSCASSGTGGLLHLTCEMYKKAAGLDVLHVPYKGATYQPDLVAGRVTLVFDNIPVYVPLVKSGRLKIIAITSATRSPVLPFVPTAIEQGLPNFDSRGLFGLLAPAGTPNDVIQLLNREIAAVLRDPAMKEKLVAQGIEPETSTPEGLRDLIQSEITKWARVIKDANIKPE
ncbi:MAG: tripartite tricarboxylate transporter substrate binding protein [Betaproteobacteria bacterium]|nr:tripartite tricarboxylate transporter substrate binding protein [Betaproteobacteria bacterium]